MCTEQQWNNDYQEETKEVGEKTSPVALRRPRISLQVTWHRTLVSAVRRHRPSYGTDNTNEWERSYFINFVNTACCMLDNTHSRNVREVAELAGACNF
jgi:hypothetical protein